MTCILRHHNECGCAPGKCDANPIAPLITENSRLNLWLSIGVAVVFSMAAVLGYIALERVERQYQMEARI